MQYCAVAQSAVIDTCAQAASSGESRIPFVYVVEFMSLLVSAKQHCSLMYSYCAYN